MIPWIGEHVLLRVNPHCVTDDLRTVRAPVTGHVRVLQQLTCNIGLGRRDWKKYMIHWI